MRRRTSYGGVVAAFAALGCLLATTAAARTSVYPLLVTLTSVQPAQATSGQLVTISGTYLETTKSVSFGTIPASSFTVDPDGKWVKAVVPDGVPNGPVTITLDVLGLQHSIGPLYIGTSPPPKSTQKSNAGQNSSGVARAESVAPRITKFSPIAGRAGTKVVINGAKLRGASSLTFGGVKARFKVRSANWIIAIVPVHAHTGKITVHTNGGKAVSSQRFKVQTGAR
jgi:hypothetical protein